MFVMRLNRMQRKFVCPVHLRYIWGELTSNLVVSRYVSYLALKRAQYELPDCATATQHSPEDSLKKTIAFSLQLSSLSSKTKAATRNPSEALPKHLLLFSLYQLHLLSNFPVTSTNESYQKGTLHLKENLRTSPKESLRPQLRFTATFQLIILPLKIKHADSQSDQTYANSR
ncbi:hypothetical protein F2Q69_00044079 [Brassica cretica]|uniref:Uncharacterized protein n=1 Tax=Brassica cretica TaxID=69181 RepID=A0A8S9NGM5_BRACR|nr:hypothetical protein F2Q69_00044079 [Brassica cretica]